MEIVDREDAQLDRRRGLGCGGQGEDERERSKDGLVSHGIRVVVPREDFTKHCRDRAEAYRFFLFANALNAAIASSDFSRSPNRWPS